jgi:3-hydroxyisobutyrate dehydrogenase-like beta-hydroxyacid dehydrogenase
VSGVIAVLGFGEAGSLIARDLVMAGAAVRGFDPKVPPPDGVAGAGSDAEAVAGADLVLSLNSAGDAVAALTASLDTLGPGAVWADLNTASPALKRRLAGIGAGRGVPVADIAMMAPVPGNGLRVPMLASGDAEYAAAALRGYGAAIEVLDGPAGLAATRKLLRSVFYKGMSASIVEALDAAEAAGLADWLRPHIAEELAAADASTVQRIVTGTRRHAVRRGHEMAAAAEMLTDLGVQPLGGRPVEVHCTCPAELAASRYNTRARHPVHHLAHASVGALAEWDVPVGIGTLIAVDTTVPVDIAVVAAQVRRHHAPR